MPLRSEPEQAEPVRRVPVAGRGVGLDAGALVLGDVHRDVGAAAAAARTSVPCVGGQGDADAALELEQHALELERLGQGDADAAGDLERRSSSRTPDSSTANSSPPRRATVSSGRTASRSRCATICRSRSPVWWPRVSLTSLNRSRSRTNKRDGLRVLAVEERGLELFDEELAVGQRRSGCRGWPGARGRARGRRSRRSRSSGAAPAAATPAPGSGRG